ncbi:MAG: hypothetical protein K2W95_23460 [Candidatus Obscuribacterales bacterium]|nr:hypothetical protein [Candidatus Obscuribacterales bacterium]
MSDEVSKIIHKGTEGLKHMASDAQKALQRLQEQALPHAPKEPHHQAHPAQPKIQDASKTTKGILPGLEIEDRTKFSDEVTGRKTPSTHKPIHNEAPAKSHQPAEHPKESAKPAQHHPEEASKPAEKHTSQRPHVEQKPSASHAEGNNPAKPEAPKTAQTVREPHAPTVDGKTWLKQIEQYGVKVSSVIEGKLQIVDTHNEKGGVVKLKNQDEYMKARNSDGTKRNSEAPHEDAKTADSKPKGKSIEAGEQPHRKSVEAKPVEPEQVNTEKRVSPANSTEPVSMRSIAGKFVNTGFGALSVVGGYYEMRDGVKDLRNGKVVDGTLKTAAGVSDTGSGLASIAYGFGKKALGTAAGKLGGAGAVFSGLGEGIQGIKENDTEKKIEGGLKVTLGAGMFASGPTAALSASGLAGWGAGRFIGSRVGWGGENIDTKTTRFMDGQLNSKLNEDLARTSSANLQLLEKNQNIVGKEEFALKAEGVTAKQVSETIIGLREQVEIERKNGNNTQALQSEITRLARLRGKL